MASMGPSVLWERLNALLSGQFGPLSHRVSVRARIALVERAEANTQREHDQIIAHRRVAAGPPTDVPDTLEAERDIRGKWETRTLVECANCKQAHSDRDRALAELQVEATRIEQLDLRLTEATAKNDQLTQSLLLANKKLAETTNSLDFLPAPSREAAQNPTNLSVQCDVLHAEPIQTQETCLEQLDTERANFTALLEEKRHLQKELATARSQMEKGHAEFAADLAQRQEDCIRYQAMYDDAQKYANDALAEEHSRLLESQAVIQGYEQQIAALRIAADFLSDENLALERQLDSSRRHVDDQVAISADELATCTLNLESKEKELDKAAGDFHAQKQAFNTKILAAESEVLKSREMVAEITAAADDAIAKLSDAREQAEIASAESARLQAALVEAKDEGRRLCQAAKDDCAKAHESLVKSRKESEELRAKLTSIPEDLSTSSAKVQELQVAMHNLHNENCAQRKLLIDAQCECSQLMQELHNRGKEVEDLESRLSAIHSKMQRMAHVSLPPGAHELLVEQSDDPDARMLAALRRETRAREAKSVSGGQRMESRTHSSKRLPNEENVFRQRN